MPTHAELAGRLLKDAADFFRKLGAQNALLKKKMDENAALFDQMSGLILKTPEGAVGDTSHGQMASQLLNDAANFFRKLADQNEHIKEQMEESANVYDQMAMLVRNNPRGILD
jgi:hypothetical protein